MEYGNWKKLIYEWVRSTKFITIAGDSIEQTNIDQFYEEFRLKLTAIILKEINVSEFLRAHYDSFEFHLDDSKEISSLDYVYIYSLLLHFSCVKYPDQYFHNLCQSLDDSSQTCIAKFFNLLLVNDKFDRDTIRAAISASKPVRLQLSADSPIKTPQYMLSPTTPRTSFMEDKRRELIFLKAQLDSERYERSVIEMLLKQTEQKVEKMSQNQRKYIEEIQSLKCDLLSRDIENRSPNKNYFTDQKNHRLQKDLLDKEERIIQLQITIDNLMDDKKSAGEKLALYEKQISNWADKSRELEQIIFDVRSEMDDRTEKIKCLQETNTDLLNFIRESRGGVHGIESLNTSSCEGLDFSFARITNSSDISTSSPENLGRSVIDIQLKEKEIENNMLRDKLELLKHDFNRIATEIRNFYSSNSDLEPLDLNESVEEHSIPLKQFELCKAYFIKKITVSDEFVKNLSAENKLLKEQINELGDVHEELRMTISKIEHELLVKDQNFNVKIRELEELVLTKTSENTSLFVRLEKQEIDIENLLSQLDSLTKTNKSFENDILVSSATIAELKRLCETRYAEIETIGCQNDLLQAENRDLISAVSQLESTVDEINGINTAENTRLTSEIVELSRILSSITDENTAAEEKIQQLTQKIFQTGEETRELRDLLGQVSKREDRLIDDHQILMEKMADVSAENLILVQQIKDIEELKKEITGQLQQSVIEQQTTKLQAEADIKELNETVLQAESEKMVLSRDMEQMSVKNTEIVDHLKVEITGLAATVDQLNKNSLELNAEKSTLIDQLKELKDILINSETKVAQILAEKSKLTEQVSKSKFDLSEFDTKVADLKLEIETLNLTNESVAKSNAEHAETIQKLEMEKNQMCVQIEHANTKIADSLSQIEQLGKIIKEISTKKKELENEKLELSKKLENFEEQILSLNHAIEGMDKSNFEFGETILKLQEEKLNLSNELDKSNKHIAGSVVQIEQLNQLLTENSRLQSQMNDEIVGLKDANEALVKENVQLIESVSKLETQTETLDQANNLITKTNLEHVATISKLQENCLNLNTQIEKINLEMVSSVTRIEELIQSVEELSITNLGLSNEKSVLIENLNKFETECNNSKIRVAQLEGSIEALTRAKDLASKSNSEYIESMTKLQEESNNLKSNINEANAQIARSVDKIEQLNQLVIENNQTQCRMNDEIIKLKAINDDILEEKFETVNKLNDEIKNLIQTNELITECKSEYSQTILKMQEDISSLTVQLDSANAEMSSSGIKIQELSQIIDEKTNELSKLKHVNEIISEEKSNLAENVTILKADYANCELRIVEQQYEMQSLNQTNESALKSISEYVETISSLEEQNRNLSSQIDDVNAKVVSFITRIQDLEQTLDETNKNNSKLITDKEELIEKLTEFQANRVDSNIKIIKLSEEIKLLRDENESRAQSNSESIEQIAKLLEENHNLNDQVKLTTLEMASSLAQIQKLNQVIDENSAKMLNLENANDMITKEKSELSEQILELQTKCANLKIEIETLNQIKEAVTQMNLNCSEIISELKEESQSLNTQLDLANKEINVSANKILKLSKIEDESLTKIDQLINEKVKLAEQVDKLQFDCVNSDARILEFTTQIQALEETNKLTTKSNSEYIENISKLQEENISLRDQINKLNAELTTSIARIQEITNLNAFEKTELTEKIYKLQTVIDSSEIRIAELSAQISKTIIQRDEITTNLETQISELILQKDELSEKLHNSALEVQILSQNNESVVKSNSEFTETVTKLGKSNDVLNSELKSVKEINSKLVDEIESLNAKVEDLTKNQTKEIAKYEILISELREEKVDLIETVTKLKNDSVQLSTKLGKTEMEVKEKSAINTELLVKIEHLDKEKAEIQTQQTENIDKFSTEISKITADNAKLSEEVIALQTELKNLLQTKETLASKNITLSTEVDEMRATSEKTRDINLRLTEELFTSESKIKDLLAENKSLGDKISALNSEIRVEKDRMLKKVEQLNHEIDNLVQNYETLQKEKTDLDVNLKIARSELSGLKDSRSDAQSNKLALIEKEQTINSLEYNLNKLHKDKLEKDKCIENLDQRISQKDMEIANLTNRLDDSIEKDKLLNREKGLNEKFTQDIAILKAKLYKHRELSEEREKQWNVEKEQLMAAIEDQKTAEERITENRLELVGKLEKMKTKMKTLYNEEMVKVKTKHENEISDLQKQAKEKFGKYDSHIEKLSKQIYQLNERNLGLEKDNKFLRTKIDFLEINTDAVGSTNALNSLGSGGSRNLLQSTNLKMEDEEGEIFNNTYLTDLKSGGRISPTTGLGRDSVKFTELQHRNSLMPRHLRSTYAAQYGDQDLREEDLKDPVNFDDSLSSLLYGGQRKKVSGATTYKRPGPPTPSKNAGRLSFGAVTELQAREVLKENNSNVPSRLSMTGTGFGMAAGNKTGKLKSFFSNSTSKIKDDFDSNSMNQLSITRKSQLQQLIITSTPRRRSQVNRCRPRLSGNFGIYKTKAQKFSARQSISASLRSADSILSQQQCQIYQQHGEWRQTESIIDSESCTSTSQTGSDCGETFVEQNTTLKSKTPHRYSSKFTVKTSALTHSRNRNRMKSKENRLENFNRARRSINNFILRKSLLNRISTIKDDRPELESDPYELLKDLVELSSQAVAAAKFNDGEPPSFAEFEKLAKFKVSEAPFDITTPETANKTVLKSSGQKKKSHYSGGVIINRKIPRLSIRIGGYHILNRGYSNDSSNRSNEHTMTVQNSQSLTRNLSHAYYLWRQCDRRMKIFGIVITMGLLILNAICAVKFLYF